ncbi:MAG TPA: HPr family phosphocarrier protein [Leptospiraceae bacterium]|nr:HPr family phosphocarrier protein [Leptospiraceae bacterium]HMW04858.1 HPr family phosphocarrier protein [Leptospiraceae bacterium]HMX35059.1 HPr family phosphocarrier protein [Leptospiraceae bacterium]HMY30394.1 HPr family phosphocarrier protein [Leptospiraceae bacterium]HMZ66819.1 HPr family phosphocarrier protein [Leptospiraceae bacterium]
MKRVTLKINKEGYGMHARPASLFVKTAAQFPCEITVIRDDIEVNGKSIMGLMMLALSADVEFTIVADGDKEEEALEALKNLVVNDFQK